MRGDLTLDVCDKCRFTIGLFLSQYYRRQDCWFTAPSTNVHRSSSSNRITQPSMSACDNFLPLLDSGVRKELHPSFCVTPSLSALKVVYCLHAQCGCTSLNRQPVNTNTGSPFPLRSLEKMKLQNDTDHPPGHWLPAGIGVSGWRWCSFSSLHPVISGSRSVVKTSWGLGAHTWSGAACASTTSAWRAALPPTHACTCAHS